jgi:hypothetical protein
MSKKTLAPAFLTTTSGTLLSNTSANYQQLVKHIHICNDTAATATFQMCLNQTGTLTSGNSLFWNSSVAASGVFDWYSPGVCIPSGYYLVADSNTASGLVVEIDYELTERLDKKLLSAPAGIPTALTPLYSLTADTNLSDQIQHIHLENPSVSSQTFSLYIQPSNNWMTTGGTVATDVAYDSTQQLFWVADGYGTGKVLAFNATTGALVYSITAGTSPVAICWDSGSNTVWAANQSSSNVTKINASTGAVVSSYSIGTGITPTDICSDGTNVWTCSSVNGAYTRTTIASGVLGGPYYITSGYSSLDVAWDGTNIWITSQATNKPLNKITVGTGAVAASYNQAAVQGAGSICYDSGRSYMWLLNSSNNTLLAVNLSGATTVGPTSIGGVGAAGRNLTYDGTSVWAVVSSGVYQVNPSTAALQTFYGPSCISPPAAIAKISAGNIYIATENNGGTLQKVVNTAGTELANTVSIAANSYVDYYFKDPILLRNISGGNTYNTICGYASVPNGIIATIMGMRKVVE